MTKKSRKYGMSDVNRAVERAVEYTGVNIVERKTKRMVVDVPPTDERKRFWRRWLDARAAKRALEAEPDPYAGMPTGTRPRFWRKQKASVFRQYFYCPYCMKSQTQDLPPDPDEHIKCLHCGKKIKCDDVARFDTHDFQGL